MPLRPRHLLQAGAHALRGLQVAEMKLHLNSLLRTVLNNLVDSDSRVRSLPQLNALLERSSSLQNLLRTLQQLVDESLRLRPLALLLQIRLSAVDGSIPTRHFNSLRLRLRRLQ